MDGEDLNIGQDLGQDLSLMSLSNFPSAKIKIEQFFLEFLCSEGRDFVNDLVNNHRNNSQLFVNKSSNNNAPPLSPTSSKKSPKKRTQAEMQSYQRDSIAANISLQVSGNKLDNNSELGSLINGDIFADEDKVTQAPPIVNKHQDHLKQSDSTKSNTQSNIDTTAITSRRRSNSDSIPVFFTKGSRSHGSHRMIADIVKGISNGSIDPSVGSSGFESSNFLHGDVSDSLMERLPEIEAFFKPFKDGIPIDKFVHVTKRLCGLPSYFNLPLCVRILEQYGNCSRFPTYKFGYRPNIQGKITIKMFLQYWKAEVESFDRIERFFRLIKQTGSSYIFRDDFMPYLQELLRFHPGLDFLENHEEFQRKYSLTVVTRIFYKINTSRSGKLSLRELRHSNVLQEFMHVDEEPDINKVTDYFSYEHFYVLYCRFFELDTDKDSFLTRENLMKYGDHALSESIVDRIFRVATRSFTDGQEGGFDRLGGMNFSDFIYFMISEEDKSTEQALRYWFDCVDLDSDGSLTPAEMKNFYKSQIHRLTSLGQESIQFQDVLCQMIDMISPLDDTSITIKDLLQPDKRRISGVIFDVLFNLHKFLRFEMRDPFQEKLRREDGFLCEWDRFAHFEYHRLSFEEEHGNNSNNNNNNNNSSNNSSNNNNNNNGDSYGTQQQRQSGGAGSAYGSIDDDDDDDGDDNMFGDDLDDDTVHPAAQQIRAAAMELDATNNEWSLDDDSDEEYFSTGSSGKSTSAMASKGAGAGSSSGSGSCGGSKSSMASKSSSNSSSGYSNNFNSSREKDKKKATTNSSSSSNSNNSNQGTSSSRKR